MTRRKPGPKRRPVSAAEASEPGFAYLRAEIVDSPRGLARAALGGSPEDLRRLATFAAFHMHRLHMAAESDFDAANFAALKRAFHEIAAGARPDVAFGVEPVDGAPAGIGARWLETFWLRNVAAHVELAAEALRLPLPSKRTAREAAIRSALPHAAACAGWTRPLPQSLVEELSKIDHATGRRLAREDALTIAARLVAYGPGVREFHGSRLKPTETAARDAHRAFVVKDSDSAE